MASILDAGLVDAFTGVVIFLLVFILVYSLLSWKKPMGDKMMGAYAIAALAIALLVSVSDAGRSLIAFVVPWFIILFIVVFMIFFIFTLFGVGPDSKIDGNSLAQMVMGPRSMIRNWIIIFSVVIIIAGLGFSFGPGLTPGGGGAPVLSSPSEGGVVIGGQLGSPVQGQGGVIQPGQPGSTATSDYGTNLLNTLVHPKVLGLIVTLIIASLAVYFLTQNIS
ncbi:MAG: hypothetical protein OXR66_05425 [Candidatus Woesearchaeota archaeon]|nr:hypothetical protein [Candidatus Woesearchaeota archaeon]